MMIETIAGTVQISGEDKAWQLETGCETLEDNIQLLRLRLKAVSKAAVPPPLVLQWSIPQCDVHYRWHSRCETSANLPGNWGGCLDSNLASQSPILTLLDSNNRNCLTWACSEAMRMVKFMAGVCEENNEVSCEIRLFTQPEAPLETYETVIRFDRRKLHFSEAVSSASGWFESLPQYRPMAVPEAAFDLFYSTWYSYHQNLFAGEIEKECELAAGLGMKAVILDDGWQTDDNHRGYGFCGDWEISRKRFPDMAGHVAKIHALGMKYLVWYSVPFVGFHSQAAKKFEGKYLYRNERLQCFALDPRFPEVREYLIEIYKKALRDWDIDGFKLDFIDSFCFHGEDPAIAENYAGRDVKCLPLAVDKLLTAATEELLKIKPGLLFEFRQNYMGPAVRKYGNLFRASDCPGDAFSNRKRTVNLRLTSGNSAVHSDMLEWNLSTSAEDAAKQLLAILFSVPQISVRLAELPESHRKMLKFYLDFMVSHRDTLLKGRLLPIGLPEGYPQVHAFGKNETVIVVYTDYQVVKLPKSGRCYLFNATGSDHLVIDTEAGFCGDTVDATGTPVGGECVSKGPARISVPVSGMMQINFHN